MPLTWHGPDFRNVIFQRFFMRFLPYLDIDTETVLWPVSHGNEHALRRYRIRFISIQIPYSQSRGSSSHVATVVMLIVGYCIFIVHFSLVHNIRRGQTVAQSKRNWKSGTNVFIVGRILQSYYFNVSVELFGTVRVCWIRSAIQSEWAYKSYQVALYCTAFWVYLSFIVVTSLSDISPKISVIRMKKIFHF